ncbi:Nucleoporin [Lachnellula suecica]|uniref:Nucleoporin n=1 Tax=Lachnellula suecica TaxID=602035 RepID=A0A8T9CS14_9HELO|nr:Nucleoporin [Lachnellula suecica]
MSSIFGNLNKATPNDNKPAQSGGGLFGGLGGSTTPAQSTAGTGSLFGGGNTQSTTPAGSIFGGGNTQSTTGTGSMFGGGNTQQTGSTGGGLFGGLGGNTQPAGSSGGSSLFGGLNTNTQPASTAGGNSLFGSIGAGSQPQQTPAGGSSIFGGPGASTSQPQQQNGGLQPPQNNATSTTQNPLQQSQQNGQNHAYFDTILEKSRKRMYGETAGEDLPQLQLGLGDLRQRIKRLGTGVGTPDRSIDGKAHYLLAASGVDPGAAVRDLNLFSAATGKVDRAPAPAVDVDVEGYLANLQTQTTLSMISDGLARSIRDFDTFLEDNVAMEWDAQRKRIYQHFGIKPREGVVSGGRSGFAASSSEAQGGGFGRSRRSKAASIAGSRASAAPNASTFGRSSLQKSVIGAASSAGKASQQAFADVEKKMETNGASTAIPTDRFQRDKQGRFAEKIQNLNLARLQKRCYPICHELASVVAQTGEQQAPELVKAYKALIDIVSEKIDVESLSDPQAVKERQFSTTYLDEAQNSAGAARVRKRILAGGTRCLEKLAFENVESFINKNPREANLGGIPNVLSKVKAYVRLLASKKSLAGDNIDLQMLGDDYVWALIYYLLRTGHIQEIVDYVQSNQAAFRAIDRNFSSYIEGYNNGAGRRLDHTLQDRINSEYHQRLRIAPENSIDPYRMACYKVIGRCDLKSRQLEGISHNVEDFVWLQLVLAREINRVDEIASEAFGLADVQKTMREIGTRFFVKGGADVGCSFGTFVFFQIACGMFEEAVAYLYPFSYTDAVHLATALEFYGLLRASDPNTAGEDLLSWTTRQNPQVNFCRMVGYYTRDFRAANVSAAVDYLVLICLNEDLPGQGGRNQVTICHDALRELVLESREFALLLGDVQSNGQRVKGLIEERMKLIALSETDDFMRTITIQAASAADDNSRTTDAILLYHLAGEYDNVMVIANRSLGEHISTPLGQDSIRLQPLKPSENPNAPQASLSLVSIDDPLELTNAMARIYGSSRVFLDKIKASTKLACQALVKMAEIKQIVESRSWAAAMDELRGLDIIPLDSKGSATNIRRYATKFASLPQAVASTVPTLIMWAISCLNGMRSELAQARFTANPHANDLLIEDIRQKNMDLTTYTSQLRYRFPAHLHEALARAQSE